MLALLLAALTPLLLLLLLVGSDAIDRRASRLIARVGGRRPTSADEPDDDAGDARAGSPTG